MELLKAQVLAASSSGSDAEASSPRMIHSARRDAAVRSDLWTSMRQDAAQLHVSLRQGGPHSPVQQKGQSLPGSAPSSVPTPPIGSISEPNIDRLVMNSPELRELSAAEMLDFVDESGSLRRGNAIVVCNDRRSAYLSGV